MNIRWDLKMIFFFVFKNKSPFLNCSSLKKFLKQIEADDIQSYLIYL